MSNWFLESLEKDNVKICPKCGRIDTIFFENDRNTRIENPISCGYCQVSLIDTGKTGREWEALYAKQFGRVTCTRDVFDWVGKLYAKDHPEFQEVIDKVLAKHEAHDKSLQEEFEKNHCPKCLSTSITQERRGFSFGKAIVATSLTGFLDVGAAAGAIGRNKMVNVCRVCGHRWK